MPSSIVGFTNALENAVDWMEQLGIRVEATRFKQYIKQLREVIATPDLTASTSEPHFPLILEAFESGGELVYIHRELKDYNSEEFLQRLRYFAKGTYLQKDEQATSSSNKARNYGFELFFAAQLVRAGFRVKYPHHSDLQIVSPVMYFECKRPQSQSKVDSALRIARDQLMRINDYHSSINVIALSLGKLIHGGKAFLHSSNERQFSDTIDGLLNQFRQDNQHVWRSESFSHVSGIWLLYSGIVVFSEMQAFVRGTYDRIIVLPDRAQPEREGGLRVLAEAVEKNNGFAQF